VLLGPLILACSNEPGSNNANSKPTSVRYPRQIGAEEELLKSEIACSDGTTRAVGDSTAVQIITFASAGDCLSCGTHAAGLDSIRLSGAVAGDFFTVAYAPQPQQAEVQHALAARSGNAICFDPLGRYWSAHDLSRTPVTVLVIHGHIAYVHDKHLDTEFAKSEFVARVRSKLPID
jgi:hypothetical protein